SVLERAPLVGLFSNRKIFYRKSVSGTHEALDSVSSLSLNTLYMIVCQFDSTIGMEIWINGVRDAFSTSRTTAMLTNSQNLRIGNTVGNLGTSGSPDMWISRPKFYNRTLTSTEIQNLKNNRLSIVAQPAIVDFSDVG